MDAVSASATLAWAAEAMERGLLRASELDGIELRWGNGEAALALTLRPDDFVPHRRMLGEGDGLLDAGPLKGARAPLLELRRDYYQAMGWDPASGRLAAQRAQQLGIDALLAGQLAS